MSSRPAIPNPLPRLRPWPRPRAGLRFWLACCLATFGCWLAAAQPASTTPALHLRLATLGYHGPSEDFTNLAEIKLGWFGPTNSDHRPGAAMWWAANLAVREANEQGGCARATEAGSTRSIPTPLPFRLVPRWAVDPWGTGVSQLARMVYDEQPLALIGSVDSATTHLAEQVVAKANLPLLSPIATDKSVTLAGVSWMFSCAPTDDAIAHAVAADIARALAPAAAHHPPPSQPPPLSPHAPHRLACLATTDHESRMIARELLRELSRRGHPPDFRFDVPPGAHDLSSQLAALQTARPAAVLIVAGAEDAARLARAVRQRFPLPTNPTARPALAPDSCIIFGTHSMGHTRFRELAGPAAEGIRFPLLAAPDPADDSALRFAARFAAEHHHPPDSAAALAYDATRLLIEAIRQAGPNRARIRETLLRLSPWPGIAGPIEFDGTGRNTRTNIVMATLHAS